MQLKKRMNLFVCERCGLLHNTFDPLRNICQPCVEDWMEQERKAELPAHFTTLRTFDGELK